MAPTTTALAEWTRGHAMTAALDGDAPLTDLEALHDIVGDARVVAIGEASHHVHEFYLVRHRLLRFLVERCGFTVYAFEAPTSTAGTIDAWLGGAPGTAEEVASRSGMMGLLDCQEMYDQLDWMREHRRRTSHPLRWTGAIPGGGSPLPELEAVIAYLRTADPDALPVLDQAVNVARSYDDAEIFRTLDRYARLDAATQDVLTTALSRLLFRMESMAAYQRTRGRTREHDAALLRLRQAWRLDHVHRDLSGRGLMVSAASLDDSIAQSVLDLLRETPDARVVLALHNVHIHRAPIPHEGGATDLLSAGYHLGRELGSDYVSIGVTGGRGDTARVRPAPGSPQGFEVSRCALPPLPEDSVESAMPGGVPLTIADLRTAATEVEDASTFRRIRMEDYFMDVPIFSAFDAIAYVPETRPTAYVRVHTRTGG
jgi:erythromycin esterase